MTISQIIGQARTNIMGAVSQPSTQTAERRQNDGYDSFGGSVLRNTATGAVMGGAVGGLTGVGLPIGIGVGAALGAGSAVIRHPYAAGMLGDGLKGLTAGAAGGALVGTVTPFGPVGGAVAGGIGGFVTGVASGLLEKVTGGKFSISAEKSVWGRITKGFATGAVSGAAVGLGAGAMFGTIGLPAGPILGALIGGVGGAIFGATSGTVDAATGAKNTTFTKGGGFKLPSLGFGGGNDGGNPGQVDQGNPQQYVGQYPGQRCLPAA